VASDTPPPPRLFKTRPGQDLIDQFLAHLRETAQPETFPGVYCGAIEKTEPFLILKPFDIGGMIALNTQYDPVDELDRIESRLRSHNHAETEEAYILIISRR
jgi:hypothetical protein